MRWQIASIRSAGNSSVIGMPATVVKRGSGTMLSPWPPRTKPCTSSTDTSNSLAIKVRKRAVSSTPAWPSTRFLGNALTR